MCMERKVSTNIFNLYAQTSLCDYCFRQFTLTWKKERFGKYQGEHLFVYDEHLKTYLYRLKGLGDIELAPLFLERFVVYFRLKYFSYYLVAAPSTKVSEEERGFNHVEHLFSGLNRPFLDLFTKKHDFKQSDFNYDERQKVSDKLKLNNPEIVSRKNILIVDDLKTTGATIKAMIKLLAPLKPKNIKVLTIAYTEQSE